MFVIDSCISNKIPGKETNGYQKPSEDETTAWKFVIEQMVNGKCGNDIEFPEEIRAGYGIEEFTDQENGKTYCVLMEIEDRDKNGAVDRAWGTFIFNKNATREINIHIPHPIHDANTQHQGIEIFKETNSRSILIAGAHRNANITNFIKGGRNENHRRPFFISCSDNFYRLSADRRQHFSRCD